MALDRFLIGYADTKSGLQSNYKPFLINDNAFELLENAYVYRGRVRKRFGSVWMGLTQFNSRLRTNSFLLNSGSGPVLTPAVTDGTGNYPALSGSPTATVIGDVYAIGQMFSIGSDTFTVVATGTPGTMLSTNPAVTVATYDTSTGAIVIFLSVATCNGY
jgi:hypothetical protein